MKIGKRKNKAGDKIIDFFDYGRGAGQRKDMNLFSCVNSKSQTEKNHNKETQRLLAIKKGERILEQQAIGTGYIPDHKFEPNFLAYYKRYVNDNRCKNNRHLPCCFTKYKKFVKRDFISPLDINYNLCFPFRKHLLDCLTRETRKIITLRLKMWLGKLQEMPILSSIQRKTSPRYENQVYHSRKYWR